LQTVSVIRQFAPGALFLDTSSVLVVSEPREPLKAGNADGRAAFGRAS